MDIDLLRTYIAVVDTGSLTRAARQVHRTQAALSMQMKRLEEQVGCSLFIKEGRNLELTPDGKQLVSYARRLLGLHDEAVNQLRNDRKLPTLRIGSPDDYAHSVLPCLVECVHAQHPDLLVQMVLGPSSRLSNLIDDGELDLAIVTRATDSDDGHVVLHDQGIWIQSPSFDWQQHTELPLALYEADCKFHSSALDGLNKIHRPYRIKAVSTNSNSLMALVRRGLVITAAATASKPPDLVEVPSGYNLPPLPSIDIALVGSTHGHPLVTSGWVGKLARNVSESTRSDAQTDQTDSCHQPA